MNVLEEELRGRLAELRREEQKKLKNNFDEDPLKLVTRQDPANHVCYDPTCRVITYM